MMQQLIREHGLAQNQRRARVPALLDHPMRLLLQNKLLASEISQDTAALALEVAGPAAPRCTWAMRMRRPGASGRWPI